MVEKELMHNAADVGPVLLDGLRNLQGSQSSIVDVRGLGLMIGVEFDTADHAHAVEDACFQKGLLVLGCGDKTIRMSPPLLLNREQAASGLRLFEDAVREVAG
jgi:4-aminobutyrate aminotransferase